MEIADIAGLAGVPIIVAIVQVAKPYLDDRRLYPLVSIVAGIVLNVAASVAFDSDWRRALILGVVAGLAASGLWSQGRTIVAA